MARRKHPALQYADDVISGKQVACKAVRLCVERHLKDLETGKDRGLYFDEEAAQYVLDFFGYCRHYKGEWAGQVIDLEPWQQFRHWVLFGWMRDDGLRRFREAYTQVGRGNGKTTEAAAIGLHLAFYDGEPGGEAYSCATKRDQARISHKAAIKMVKKSPELKSDIGIRRDNLFCEATDSMFEPLGADADTLDGLRPNVVLVDELHAHPNGKMLDVMDTGTGARRQPMLYVMTTAGDDLTSVCYDQYTYAMQVLKGVIQDDTFFVYIAELDEGDDWEDQALWVKPNPNLNVSVKLDDLQRKAKKAKMIPGRLNGFLTKHMDMWVRQVSRWIDLDSWDACSPVDPENHEAVRAYIDKMEHELEGQPCLAGLDLGYARDLSAFALIFPPKEEGGNYRLVTRFWMPEESPERVLPKYREQYEVWLREGWIIGTPGNVVDYGIIERDMLRLAEIYEIREAAFDRMFAGQLAQNMQGHGWVMIATSQGFSGMNAASREFETLILDGRLDHGGHPVQRWMVDCVSIQENSGGNIRPAKPERKTGKKIDGVTAAIMGLGRTILHEEEGPSVYETRGILTV
ncbi:MAG: terminase large subunit [Chloroflexi bacterium]|nr:terminase large subunit [Chloroflexota bacterium]